MKEQALPQQSVTLKYTVSLEANGDPLSADGRHLECQAQYMVLKPGHTLLLIVYLSLLSNLLLWAAYSFESIPSTGTVAVLGSVQYHVVSAKLSCSASMSK